jgi:drug/metabolite transporter (DMT)-like permease
MSTRASGSRPAGSRGLLALLLGAACIGIAPVWVRWSEVGAVATAFHRLLLALPFLVFWAAREPATPGHPTSVHRSSALRPPPGLLLAWAAAGGVCFGLDLAAWHLSIRLTTVANATLLANFAPIFVTLGAWIFLRERAQPRFFAGMAVALAGAWLLTGASLRGDPTRLRGDALALVTAVFYGGYQLCVARLRRDLGTGRILLWTSLVCTPVLGLIALALGETIWPPTPRAWLVLVGLALTAQILGQGLITYGFAHLPAGYSSLTLLLQPLVATAAGWALFGEAFTPLQATGAAILLTGILLARRTP